MSNPGYHARHRRRRSNPARVALMGATGSLLLSGALVGTAAAASSTDFARLRQCESSGNYRVNTGNGYYGAYQFDLQTWRGLGLSGRPDQASPATQDAAARELQAARGWAPWPACSRRLGLVGGGGQRASRSGARTALVGFHANLAYVPVPAPVFRGVRLTQALVGQVRPDVRAWQHQMKLRGWALVVDGRFGPRSAAVAAAFQRQLHAGGVGGVVGPMVWRLTWQAPVAR